MKLKRLGILSYAKLMALGMATFGFFYGLSLSLIYRFGNPPVTPEDAILRSLGFGLIIVAPVVYAIIGILIGIVTAWLYNIFAGWIGGIEMEFEKK
jgi:Na+(H+)/acetate symporter ActP